MKLKKWKNKKPKVKSVFLNDIFVEIGWPHVDSSFFSVMFFFSFKRSHLVDNVLVLYLYLDSSFFENEGFKPRSLDFIK